MKKNRCRELRGNRAQADIAELLGITQQGYCYIENNENPPKMEMCIKLSKIYNKPINYIFPAIILDFDTKNICEEEKQRKAVTTQ